MFKTILAWAMMFGHIIMLISDQLGQFGHTAFNYVNLTTFSGFLFAFGFGVGMARGGIRPKSLQSRITPAFVMLISTYLVGFCYVTLVEEQPITPEFLLDLFSLRVLFGYNEFLASFFVLYLIIAFARPLLRQLQESTRAMFCVCIICMSSTFLVTDAHVPLIGTLIGNTTYGSFPLIPYFPLFLLGLYYAHVRRAPDLLEVAAAIATTAAYVISVYKLGDWHGRFPPTKSWVTGSAGFLLVYWSLSLRGADFVPWKKVVFACGRHVLACLVFSTLLLFAVRYYFDRPINNYELLAASTIVLVVATTGYCLVVEVLQDRISKVVARTQRPRIFQPREGSEGPGLDGPKKTTRSERSRVDPATDSIAES